MNDAVQVQVAHIELLLHTFSSLLLLLFHNMQQQKLMALPSGAILVVKRIQGLSQTDDPVHSGRFPEVLFRCENVGRQHDFANF